MKTKETEGYDLAKGALCYVAQVITWIVLVVLVANGLRLALGIGMDDSDASRWNRSGLTVYKDAKTGIEYLSDRHGGLVRRGNN